MNKLILLSVLILGIGFGVHVYLSIPGANGFGGKTSARQVIEHYPSENIGGRVYLITGTNTGIGYETAKALVETGAQVVVHARSPSKAQETRSKLILETGADNERVRAIACDLSSLQAVGDCVGQWKSLRMPSLDALILNAGVMAIPERTLTQEGFETQLGVNHFAHFALTNALLDDLLASAKDGQKARVVVVSSSAGLMSDGVFLENERLENPEYKMQGFGHYLDSKLMNILFAKELHRRFFDRGLLATSLHPGVIVTDLQRTSPFIRAFFQVFPFFSKTVEQGAATSVFCAVAPESQIVSGQYHADCNPGDSSKIDHLVNDAQLTERFWKTTVALLNNVSNLPQNLAQAINKWNN